MATKDVPVLTPGICEYVRLNVKEKLILQMELMLLISWTCDGEIILDYPGGSM